MSNEVAAVVTRALDTARASPASPVTVVAAPYCSTPATLLDALAASAQPRGGVVDQLGVGLMLGGAEVDAAVRQNRLGLTTWHPHGVTRSLVQDGAARYVRLRASELAARLTGRVDVALLRVGPPDRDGWCSVGPSGSITRPLISAARVVVAELDPTVPRLHGPGARVHIDEVHHVVDTQTRAVWPDVPAPTPAMTAAAARVVDLISSGASVQLGIGSLPEAVGTALARSDLRDLRLVGMGSRAALEMAATGVLAAGPDTVRVAEILGEDDVARAFDDHPALELHSTATMHQPAWLGRIPGLVSVCTGLQLDEQGNVGSERIGDRVISGIGGSVDFIEGARASVGGMTVLVMTAAGPKGGARLVDRLPADRVTVPGHLIDVVATEHGTVDVRGTSGPHRAELLRSVFPVAAAETSLQPI